MTPNAERYQNGPGERDGWGISRRYILKTGALAPATAAILDARGTGASRLAGNDSFHLPISVTDREDTNPNPAIRILEREVPIRDWIVFGTETVPKPHRRNRGTRQRCRVTTDTRYKAGRPRPARSRRIHVTEAD